MIKKMTFVTLGLSVILDLAAVILVKNDPSFYYRWPAFWIYMTAVLLVVTFYIGQEVIKKEWRKVWNKRDLLALGLVLVVTGVISFIFISNYPFVSAGDELRDGGLNAMQIANGDIKNIFGYGAYNSHGLIIPTITSFFYKLFGISVLTYRFPAAAAACLDVAMVFVLIRSLLDKRAAFFGALALATLPLHMFFARTQAVIAFNSLLTSGLLLSFYLFSRKQRLVDYAFLGTVLGFVFGFHAAVRVVAILIFVMVLVITLGKDFKQFFFIQILWWSQIIIRLKLLRIIILNRWRCGFTLQRCLVFQIMSQFFLFFWRFFS